MGKEVLDRIQDEGLSDALRKAGIAVGLVSAVTLEQLAKVLSTLDEELVRLEYRRQRALKALIVSRAKATKVTYLNARQLEVKRTHEWKVHKDGCEFARKYEGH